MSTVALERSKTYFEQFVAGVPDPLRDFTRSLLWPFEQLLELVAGDPDDLIRGAERCLAASTEVLALADQQRQDRAQLAPPAWGGSAAESFQSSMANLEEAIGSLSGSLGAAKDVLVEAANAAVDAFNLLLELIFEFLVALAIEALVAAAAAALSFGASIAAFAVRWLGRLAVALSRGTKIVMRFGRLLNRLEDKLRFVQEWLLTYSERVMELRKLKKEYALWKGKGRTPEGLKTLGEHQLKVGLPRFAFNALSPINLSGMGGAVIDTGLGLHDISDGTKDRDYLRDGTYSDDLGPYTRGVQNLIDSVGY